MSKITLTNLSSMQNNNTVMAAINSNNAIIQTAMDNTLSRDGTLPDQMTANLDMNSNRVINLPYPVTDNEPLRFKDFKTFTVTPTIGATAYDINWTTPSTGGTTKSIGTVLQRTFDVRDFGAVCNGVTDDTLAIQRCINAAEAEGNDSVVLLHKASLISTTLNITSPVTIKGNGKSNTFIYQSNSSLPIISFSPSSANLSVNLKGFGAYYQVLPSQGASPAGIAFGNASYNCTDCIIDDVAVINAGTGIYFQNIINVSLLNSNVTTYSDDGIRIFCPISPDSGGITLEGNNIGNPTSVTGTHGINWNSGGGVFMSNNRIVGSVISTGATGLFFNMTAQTTEFQLCNNLIVGFAVAIQMARSPGLFMYQMLINDNVFDSNNTSIYVPVDTIWLQMLTITGNGFQGASNNAGPQISLAGVAGAIISGNTFLSNKTGGGMTCVQIVSSCQDIKIGPNARTVQLNAPGPTLASDIIAGTNITIVGGG